MKQDQIKYWAKDDQPRDRLVAIGQQAMSNAELLAILLRTGSQNKSAVSLAREILNECNNDLHQLAQKSVADLCKITGMGKVKAVTVIAALELGGRKNTSGVNQRVIRTSQDAYDTLSPLVKNKVYEEFWIILLKRNNRIIQCCKVSEGGITGTVADPKRIFKLALENHATSIILCHNHPSGNRNPSNADTHLTHKIQKAGQHLDINVLDHLIITQHGYYSFADEGELI